MTLKVNDLKNAEIKIEPGTVVNNTIVNGYTTDITNVVLNVSSKVVTVQSSVNYEYVYSTASCIKYEEQVAYFVTNYHGVKDSENINVIFDSGAISQVTIVGYDEITDLAVLKANIDFKIIPFNFGDASLLKKGEFIVSIGTPVSIAYQNSVLIGNISGVKRSFTADLNNDEINDWETLMIQTNLLLNEGDSGGPLINMSGELVGINTFKLVGNNIQGMSFAIPINEARLIIEEIIETGTVTRSTLNITGKNMTDMSNYQKSYLGLSLDMTYGIYVEKVQVNSETAKAGLKQGDILIKINNKKLDNLNVLINELYYYSKGDIVEISYLRDGVENKVSVNLE